MTTIGLICIGVGIGVLLAGVLWWDAGFRAGYRNGIDDANALICGEVIDVETR